MKVVLVVVSIGNRPWFNYCHPWMNLYCKRFEFDFLICHRPLLTQIKETQFRKFQDYGRCQKLGIRFLFDEYDRIIQLDDSCMIAPDTPDLSSIVPQHAIGCFIEGPSKAAKFDLFLKQHKLAYARTNELPRTRFYNNGVAVYSREHAAIFDPAHMPWKTIGQQNFYPTGGFLSHRADELGIALHDLGPKFNVLGSRVKKLATPADAGAYIFHLTSMLDSDERLAAARTIDAYFRSLMGGSTTTRDGSPQVQKSR